MICYKLVLFAYKCQIVKIPVSQVRFTISLKINEKSDLGKDVGNISFLLRRFIFRKKITGLAVLQLQV